MFNADCTEVVVDEETQHWELNMTETQIDIKEIIIAIFEKIYYRTSFDMPSVN